VSYGYAEFPFRLTVSNTGEQGSERVWLSIGKLSAIAGAALSKSNFSGQYVWDDSILSDTMGTIFIRGPRISAGVKKTLTWTMETIYLGRAVYTVTAYTGGESISTAADLTPTGDSWGPMTTYTIFC
jgi:hypothetical protein